MPETGGGKEELLLSVLVPVYNERDNIRRIVDQIKRVDIAKEIIVVDDFSTDGTRALLNEFKDVKVLLHEKNKGKGAAIRTGLAQAQGRIVIVQDADLEYSPREYPRLIAPITRGQARAVYGSRILGRGAFLTLSYYANRLLTAFTGVLYRRRITDMETCYKVIDRRLMLSLNLVSARFEIEPEITCKLLKKKEPIVEVPISYQSRKKGKKIGPRDGLQAVWNIIKWKFKR